MEFWDKVKDRVGKTLSTVESRARDIKDSVDQELKIRKLKNLIEDLRAEIGELHREAGESVLESLRQEKSLDPTSFKQHLEYLLALEKKVRDVEEQLNEIYQEDQSASSSEEIVVDPEDQKNGSK